MNTIQEQWENFKKHVIPHDAPEIQVTSMKQAFYGGASGLLMFLMRLEVDTEAGAQMLEFIRQELKIYWETQ